MAAEGEEVAVEMLGELAASEQGQRAQGVAAAAQKAAADLKKATAASSGANILLHRLMPYRMATSMSSVVATLWPYCVAILYGN